MNTLKPYFTEQKKYLHLIHFNQFIIVFLLQNETILFVKCKLCHPEDYYVNLRKALGGANLYFKKKLQNIKLNNLHEL